MTLENLIYTRLVQSNALSELLARYNGAPAAFYQSAPMDTDPGWQGAQYPRLDFLVDTQSNPERQTSGVVTVNIWCSEEGAHPEDLEPFVRLALCNVFLSPSEGPPYSLAWVRSEPFESKSSVKPETLVTGITMIFDAFAFPRQVTFDPDPILTMNRFVREWKPQVTLIGQEDPLPDFLVPTRKHPAMYFRLVSEQLERETNTVAWMTGTVVGHIFAPDAHGRMEWLRLLSNTLSLMGEVIMLDGSPMFLRNLQADSTWDHLVQGQLRLQVHFGLLRRFRYAHPLILDRGGNINVNK